MLDITLTVRRPGTTSDTRAPECSSSPGPGRRSKLKVTVGSDRQRSPNRVQGRQPAESGAAEAESARPVCIMSARPVPPTGAAGDLQLQSVCSVRYRKTGKRVLLRSSESPGPLSPGSPANPDSRCQAEPKHRASCLIRVHQDRPVCPGFAVRLRQKQRKTRSRAETVSSTSALQPD